MIAEALQILTNLADRSGFRASRIEKLQGAPQLPGRSAFYVSSYARLLVVTLEDDESPALTEAAKLGQEWIDISCISEERKRGAVVDGYLVLLLKEKPTDEQKPLIRSIELNPTSCRKHVVWPVDGETPDLRWHRLYKVTCLGIPASPKAGGIPGSPALDKAMSSFLDVVRAAPSARQAALAHSEDTDFRISDAAP